MCRFFYALDLPFEFDEDEQEPEEAEELKQPRYENRRIVRHRNYKIEAYYDNAVLYYSIFHRNGHECVSDFTSEAEPIDRFIDVLKGRIDEEVSAKTYFRES